MDVPEKPPARREAALRRLPDAYSLALRLTAAGAAPEVICQYLHIAPEGLDTLLSVAHQKLAHELSQQSHHSTS